jgi:hypothetical protein
MKQPKAHAIAGVTANPKDQRHALTVDDLQLCAEAKSLLDSLTPELRPNHLPERFPRVMNEIARLWRRPDQLDRYFDDLLMDKRTGRQGFPLAVALELSTLKDYYQAEVYPKKECVWEKIYTLPTKAK